MATTLKATWMRKRNTGTARHIYKISGNSKQIAQFIEHQGENARFLQEDGTIGVDETSVPVFYSKADKGKVADLRYAADIDAWILDMTYEEERIRSIMREAYGLDTDSTSRIAPNPAVSDDDDEDEDEDAAPAPAPAKKPRRKIG